MLGFKNVIKYYIARELIAVKAIKNSSKLKEKYDYLKNYPASTANNSIDLLHEDEWSTFSQSTKTDEAKCFASETFLIGYLSSIMKFFKLLLSEFDSSQKEGKLNKYDKGSVEFSSRILSRALQNFPCHVEEKYSAVFAAEIGTDVCKYGVDERNQIVNYKNEAIAVVFDFWFFLPSICEQFYN